MHYLLAFSILCAWSCFVDLVIAQSGHVDPNTVKDCTLFTDYPDPYFPDQGNTCASLAEYWGITERAFIIWNPSVGNDCSHLVEGNSYCVEENFSTEPSNPKPTSTSTQRPTSTRPSITTTTGASGPSPTQSGLTKDCKRFYFIKSGDTCYDIVDSYGTFTLNQFYSWNPAVGNNCQGLQANVYVCVGVSNTPTAPPTNTSPSEAATPTPIQSGTISTCNKFVKSSASGAACDKFARGNKISLAQLYAWNRILGVKGENCASQFKGSMNYCVGVSKPLAPPNNGAVQAGVPDTCWRYGRALDGGTCPSFADRFKISESQLYTWNPVLGSNGRNCQTKFWAGYWYCVEVAG